MAAIPRGSAGPRRSTDVVTQPPVGDRSRLVVVEQLPRVLQGGRRIGIVLRIHALQDLYNCLMPFAGVRAVGQRHDRPMRIIPTAVLDELSRSEERRVGKE